MRCVRGVTVVFLAAGLASGPAGPAVVAAAEAVRQQRVDYDRSTIVAVLHKAGLLRFLGHEHGILVKDWSAEVEYDPARPEQTKVSVTVRTPTLEIDSAPARRLAAVDPDGPNEEQTLEIRDQMLGTEQLDAETYPTMTFVSTTGVKRRSDRELRLRGTLSVHGRSRAIEVSVRLGPVAEGVRVTGEFAIKQRDYGIEPVSIGGVVKVVDELDIKFDVFLTTER